MKNKLILSFILFTLCLFTVFGSYTIKIEQAGDVTVEGNVFTLTDNVKLSFKTTDRNDDEKDRTLSAYQIIVNTEEKTIKAFGNVVLKEGEDTFSGNSLQLNWDNLDVLVYGGMSSSVRDNSSGDSVEFFASGESISYAGDQDTVLFHNGVIATTKDKPYWSISAKKIGLLESDLYFERAIVKLGRVPIMYLPAFFYPGTKLAFNPAMGLSSSKGKFLNTTFEFYGKYPKIGTKSTSGDAGDAASLFSFLESGEKKETVRDGMIYTSNPTGREKSQVEQWADKTSSYLALFADVSEYYGPVIGFDTNNKFNKFNFNAIGAYGFNNLARYPEKRYALDLSANMSLNKTSFSVKVPFYSDPDARYTYFNRNTVFGLDSVFGTEQSFPSDYGSYDSSFSWVLNGKTSLKLGKLSLNIGSIKGQVDWNWNSSERKYKVTAATFPYVSISSSGTIFSWQGKEEKVTEEVPYSSELAEAFYQENLIAQQNEADTSPTDFAVKPLKGPDLKRNVEKTINPASLSSTYSYSQSFSRTYKSDMKPDTFNTAASGSVGLSGRLAANKFIFSSSVSPSFKYTDYYEKETTNKELVLKGSLNASSPNNGVSYAIGGKIYSLKEEENPEEKKSEEENFQWTEDFITTHYVQYSKTFGNFSASLRENLAPVTESFVPSISYKNGHFSASAGTTIYWGDEVFKKGKATLNTGFSSKNFSVSLNNTYNFEQEGWNGYSATQNASLYLFDRKLAISEKMLLENKFKPKSMNISASLFKTSASLSMTGEHFDLNNFSVSTSYKLDPVYLWKNRIGLSSSLSGNLVYNFANKYGTTFSVNFSVNLAVLKFLTLDFSVKSANTSFFRYYENDKFNWRLMFEDLGRSFDFFNSANRSNTGFNMTSYSFALVHYLEDFNLYVDGSSKFVNEYGRTVWKPEITVYIKWKAIPELKVENTWNKNTGWEK